MKLTGLSLIATILAGSIALAAPASAQERHVEVSRTTRTVVHNDRHVQVNHRKHKVCSTRWVHHRKVRRCTWR
jgi:hypothetical protein